MKSLTDLAFVISFVILFFFFFFVLYVSPFACVIIFFILPFSLFHFRLSILLLLVLLFSLYLVI